MRLTGFDDSEPLFYMRTLKCLPGKQALPVIVSPGKCAMPLATRAMRNCIRTFHLGCSASEPIKRFTIMPGHVYLLIKIRDRLGSQLAGLDAVGGGSPVNLAPANTLKGTTP